MTIVAGTYFPHDAGDRAENWGRGGQNRAHPDPHQTALLGRGEGRGCPACLLVLEVKKIDKKNYFWGGHSFLLCVGAGGGSCLFSHTPEGKPETREAAALLGITHQG